MSAAITLLSPYAPAELFVESMVVEEGLSQLGRIELQLLSPLNTISADRLLGKTLGLKIEDAAGHKRHFHGHVVRFGHGMARGRFHSYHAEVRPWPWFLTRTADCRIFQDLTVPEIVQQVFDDHPGFAQLKPKLMRTYRKWTYCVQYRETDFQFISRLLEHEGIYWHIDHEPNKHTLVLMDTASGHDPIGGEADLRFIENPATAAPDQQYLSDWRFDTEIQTEAIALASYDFERPVTLLDVDHAVDRSHPGAGAERFDYQGDYLQTTDGKQLAEDLLDAEQSRYQRFAGAGSAMHLAAGHTFTLKHHPRGDQNAKYLITRVRLQAQVGVFDGASTQFRAALEAIPASQQFRAPRTTPKPVVQGPQTARVVGPAGEEIFTDKYGRVKVQFHWDRRGKNDDKSSCWMRVSQPWAGKHYGAIYIPRVGHEVVVSFLEGDPDQPLITGRVYNADQLPPWTLPDNATQSGILTRSTKDGNYSNANQIQFEDKKGHEALNIHAERNLSMSVEVDASHSVGHDESTVVSNAQTIVVDKGQRKVFVNQAGEDYYVKGPRNVFNQGKTVDQVKEGHDSFVTGLRAEYVDGDRKSFVSGQYQFKSTKAYFEVGPEFVVNGVDFAFNPTGKSFFFTGGDHTAKAANFTFFSPGNMSFTCNNFNRTIFQGNDTVLGPNTNTYIGLSRDTAVGTAISAVIGTQNSVTTGMSMDGYAGMQISNFLGLQMSNAVALSVSNAAINMGMTGMDMGLNGISLENNGLKVLSAGGGGGAGGAAAAGMSDAGLAALSGGIAGLLFGAVGLSASMDAAKQRDKDIDALIKSNSLTPATRARLQAVLDGNSHAYTPEDYDQGLQSSVADQMALLGQQAEPTGDAAPPAAPPAVTPPAPPAAPASPPGVPGHG